MVWVAQAIGGKGSHVTKDAQPGNYIFLVFYVGGIDLYDLVRTSK